MEPTTTGPVITSRHFVADLHKSDASTLFFPILNEIRDRSCHPIFCEHESCPTCRYTAVGVFIRAMGDWETFLEDAIIHEMCAASIKQGAYEPHGRSKFTDKEDALRRLRETLYDDVTGSVLEGATARGYILLHDPQLVCAVADYWVRDSRVSAVIARNRTKVENLTNIRHAAAHAAPRTQHLLKRAIQYFAPEPTEDDNTEAGAFLLTRSANGQLMLAYLLNELSELAKSVQSNSSQLESPPASGPDRARRAQ